MPSLTLTIPEEIREALPEDGQEAALDMERAVAGWEGRLNAVLEATEGEEMSEVVDVLERFEERWEQYDDLVAELRAWGQSPIYAIAWRDLYAALIAQVYDHEGLSQGIERERHARIVSNGIRRRR